MLIRIRAWLDVLVLFTVHRKLAASSLGGEVLAHSELADHMLPLKDFFGPLRA